MTARPCVITASPTDAAQKAKIRLLARYPDLLHDKKAVAGDTILVLGGDGFMLRTLKTYRSQQNPLFGLNLGHLGFLMNPWYEEGLIERIENAVAVPISSLKMTATDKAGNLTTSYAFNEITILRRGSQSIHLDINTDDGLSLENLKGDGVIVATPAGSPAYNYSARGPILPIDSGLLALTPINPFHPRGWRGAVLHNNAHISISIINHGFRPAIACADTLEVPYVSHVDICNDTSSATTILFDPDHDIRARILKEQFST